MTYRSVFTKTKNNLKKLSDKSFREKLSQDDILEMSASLAFYSALSMAPLLILLLTFISLIDESFRQELLEQIQSVIGTQASSTIRQIAENVDQQPEVRNIAGIAGTLTLLISAGAIFRDLQHSLNKIFGIKSTGKDKSKKSTIQIVLKFLKEKLLNMGMVLGFIFISIVSLFASSILSFLSKGILSFMGELANLLISIFIYGFLFAAIYYFLPKIRVDKKIAITSGFITAVLFSIGKSLIGLYVGRSAVASLYGAAGSFIVLLLWVYYSAAIFFVSAEIANQVNREAQNEQAAHIS